MTRWTSLESVPAACAWEDVGLGDCTRCATWRRLYRPVNQSSQPVCSACARVLVNNGLTNLDREFEPDED